MISCCVTKTSATYVLIFTLCWLTFCFFSMSHQSVWFMRTCGLMIKLKSFRSKWRWLIINCTFFFILLKPETELHKRVLLVSRQFYFKLNSVLYNHITPINPFCNLLHYKLFIYIKSKTQTAKWETALSTQYLILVFILFVQHMYIIVKR